MRIRCEVWIFILCELLWGVILLLRWIQILNIVMRFEIYMTYTQLYIDYIYIFQYGIDDWEL